MLMDQQAVSINKEQERSTPLKESNEIFNFRFLHGRAPPKPFSIRKL
jgi:hypothetical protein